MPLPAPRLPPVPDEIAPVEYVRLTQVFTIPVIDELARAYATGVADVVAARAAGVRPVDLAILIALADADPDDLPTHAARALASAGRDLLRERARTQVRAMARVRRAGRSDWKAAFALADRTNAPHVEGDAVAPRGGRRGDDDLDDAIADLLARGRLRDALDPDGD